MGISLIEADPPQEDRLIRLYNFNFLEKEKETIWEIRAARRIRQNPISRKKQKKTRKRKRNKDC